MASSIINLPFSEKMLIWTKAEFGLNKGSAKTIKFFRKYPEIRTVSAIMSRANLAALSLAAYIEVLAELGRDVMSAHLGCLADCFGPPSMMGTPGTYSEYFGHVLNTTFSHRSKAKDMLERIKDRLPEPDIAKLQPCLEKSDRKLVSMQSLKHIMMDGINFMMQMEAEQRAPKAEKEQRKEEEKKDILFNIEDLTTLVNLDDFCFVLEKCARVLFSRITLYYKEDGELKVRKLGGAHYDEFDMAMFFDTKSIFLLYPAKPRTGTGMPLVIKPVPPFSPKKLSSSGKSSGSDHASPSHSGHKTGDSPEKDEKKVLPHPMLEDCTTNYSDCIGTECAKLVTSTFGFFCSQTEKKADLAGLRGLLADAQGLLGRLYPTEQVVRGKKAVKKLAKKLSNDDLIKRTVFNPLPVEISMDTVCGLCGASHVAVITRLSTCQCTLAVCVRCFVNSNKDEKRLACTKCNAPISPEAADTLRRGICDFCQNGILKLTCGHHVDAECLRKKMQESKDEKQGLDGVKCKLDNTVIDFAAMAAVDSDLASDLSLDQCIYKKELPQPPKKDESHDDA